MFAANQARRGLDCSALPLARPRLEPARDAIGDPRRVFGVGRGGGGGDGFRCARAAACQLSFQLFSIKLEPPLSIARRPPPLRRSVRWSENGDSCRAARHTKRGPGQRWPRRRALLCQIDGRRLFTPRWPTIAAPQDQDGLAGRAKSACVCVTNSRACAGPPPLPARVAAGRRAGAGTSAPLCPPVVVVIDNCASTRFRQL